LVKIDGGSRNYMMAINWRRKNSKIKRFDVQCE